MAISLPTHRPAASAASTSSREPSTPQDVEREDDAGHVMERQEPPQVTVPAADTPGAIPQSSAPPSGLLHHLDAEEMRRRAAEERNVLDWARWRADAHTRIFRVVLGDAEARARVDVSCAGEDVESGWRTVAVDAYLRSFIHGKPLPTGPLARDLLRHKVSIVMFNGRGGDSDDAFHAELVKAAGTCKKNVELAGDRAQRMDRAAKLRRLYGPEAAGEGEEALAGLESLAGKAHVFTPRSFLGKAADYFNLDEQTPAERTAMYARYRDAMAEEYGLTTAELEDVLRHRTFMAGRQASATYDDAIRRNFSTDQAEDLALKAGSIEFLTTLAFSAAGAGGVEGIASGAARQALRESLRGTARNALRESLMAGGKGMLGEMAEEQIITALDAALVQAELRPGMTAEDFQRAVYETAVVTFISSGGFAVAHGKHAYDDTLAGNARIGERVDVAPTSIYPTGNPPPVVDAPPQKNLPIHRILKNGLVKEE